MDNKSELIKNIDKIHTTELGVGRVKRNLNPNTDDIVKFCVELIKDKNSIVTKKGKNYYINLENKEITVNASSFTIITAHMKKNN